MKALTDHARRIAGPLSESLAQLEVRSTAIAMETAHRAIHDAWLAVVDEFEHGRANLSSTYIANIHTKLAAGAGLANSGGFADQGALPILPDGTAESWSRFSNEC